MAGPVDVVVIGAGIAGVSTAFELTVRHGVTDVVVVDPRPPLSLTSDKSTECYRNWWPNAPMVGLMNRSIDLLEEMAKESGNVFGMNRRGYLFVTADPARLAAMRAQVAHTAALGADAELVGPEELARRHPYLSTEAVGAVRVPRAGWLSAQQLGTWMLERARGIGTRLIRGEVTGIDTGRDGVTGVILEDGSRVEARTVVSAAGPLSKDVGALAGVDLPLVSELHLKVGFRDHLEVIPREAPMVIWSDPQTLDWPEEERTMLLEMGRDELVGELPVFCHGRPEGGAESPWFLALWEYHRELVEPTWPLPEDPLYPEVVMRGLTTMIPGLAVYRDRLPESMVDGGYYTKTAENRPLIGPCGPDGFHVVTGMSGFGVMAAAGAADLAARHILGLELPSYAPDFLLDRYDDPTYQVEISDLTDSGQL